MKKGFTLIELLIYVAILSVVLLSVIVFFWSIVSGDLQEAARREARQNVSIALLRIERFLDNAVEITSPAPGFSSDELIVKTYPSLDASSINSFGLASESVEITSLNFTNVSRGVPGAIRVEIEIHSRNPSNKPELEAFASASTTFNLNPKFWPY